MARIKKLISRA